MAALRFALDLGSHADATVLLVAAIALVVVVGGVVADSPVVLPKPVQHVV